MSHDADSDAFGQLRDLLRSRLEASEEWRCVVRLVATVLAEEVSRAELGLAATAVEASTPVAPQSPEPAASTASRPIEPVHPVAEVPLRIGDASIKVEVRGAKDDVEAARRAAEHVAAVPPVVRDEPHLDLHLIERRARLKAESCRTCALLRSGSDLAEDKYDQIRRAKAMPECFLWVYLPEHEPPDNDALEVIGQNYCALAEGAALLSRIDALGERAKREALEEAMHLFAEASSALRVVLMQSSWLTRADVDQEQAHLWLRVESRQRSVYIARHMKIDDPADPWRAGEVLDRLTELRTRVEGFASNSKAIAQAEKVIDYHARRIDAHRPADGHDLNKIERAASDLLDLGVQPSDRRWSALLPSHVADALRSHEGLPSPVRQILDHLDRREPDAEHEPEAAPRAWSENVLRVRAMLAGRSIVMVGGEPRPHAIDRIREAFDLGDVYWPWITEHASSEPLRAPIQRAETAAVCVLIKLAGHLHVSDAKEFAREASKPCIMLTAGYNPEQIGLAIVEQASLQLAPAAE